MYNFEEIRQHVDDYDEPECICRFGAALIVYYKGTFKENSAGLLKFYNTVLPFVKSSTTYFHIDGKNQPRKVRNDTFDLVPFWASDDCDDRGIYGLTLESGNSKYDVSDRSFQFYEGMHEGYLRVVLPAEFLSNSPDEFFELVLEAVSELDFWSGVGGYGLSYSPGYPTYVTSRRCRVTGGRYRCVDVATPRSLASSADKGIKDIGWLTLIGNDFIDSFGGKEKLVGEVMSVANVGVHDTKSGAVLRIGEGPIIGNNTENLGTYRQIGETLKSISIPPEELDAGDAIGGELFTEEWIYRFFR